MQINRPFFAIEITGNKRDECAKLPYTYFAAQQNDKTMVFVLTKKLNRQSRRAYQAEIASLYGKIGTVESCNYYESGEIIQISSN